LKSDALNIAAVVLAVLLLAAGGPWLVRELKSLPTHRALAARGNSRVVTLEVGGMSCSGCAKAVKGQLAGLPGVEAVDVQLGQRRAYVVCDPAVAETSLVAAVHRAGPGFSASLSQR
jgi:copper chaperone CopZ